MGDILKNPFPYAILAIVLFVYVPTIRIIVIVVVFLYFIARDAKNGLTAYFAYSSLGALLNSLLSILNENGSIYNQIETSASILTVASIGNLFDLVVYTKTAGWNGFENLIAAILFGVTAFLIQKSS